jgi:hypothetical protein
MNRHPVAALIVGVLAAVGPARGQDSFAERVATGLTQPVYVTHAPGDAGRLFICEKPGRIRILNLATGQINPTHFLTIPDTDDAGDGGLQSMTFHPDYTNNGRFFVHVTVDNGGIDGSPFSSHIREYCVSTDPDVADPTPIEILNWIQPQSNHNGGWIGFNPKLSAKAPQFLYICSGDGGSQHDPENDAQTLENNFLGKMLRVDIDSDDFPADPLRNYAVPAANPFVGVAGDDELWSYGFRNPWRASFDRATADLYIGDVGQSAREEVDLQLASSPGGENYAWNRREGFIAHQGGVLLPGDTQPIYDYPHGAGDFAGASIVGGYVYRGPVAAFRGRYIFCDTISNNIWMFDPLAPIASVTRINALLAPNAGTLSFVVSFGEDALGNLYLVTFAGSVYRVAQPCTMTGDIDGDGDVDLTDLAVLIGSFGTQFGATIAEGNLDGDSDVDLADLALLLSAFGEACP